MNYLAHFVYNHDVCGLPREPYFAMGVALPDLWLRYSRSRRIRWRAVQAATVTIPPAVHLRDGLLNHREVDRQFHGAPVFRYWQRMLKGAVGGGDVRPAVVDFLAHMAIELALDYHLLRADPALVGRFYDTIAPCDPAVVARRVGMIAAVQTPGLDDVVRKFIARRFLRHYRSRAGLADVVRIVLALATIPAPPPAHIDAVLAAADALVEPEQVWAELTRGRGTETRLW